jgi:hypothetical protein
MQRVLWGSKIMSHIMWMNCILQGTKSVSGGRQSQSSCSDHFATGGPGFSVLYRKSVLRGISGNTVVSRCKILGLVGDCNHSRPLVGDCNHSRPSRSQSMKQWLTEEGSVGGFNPPYPKFRSFDKAEPNSQFRGKHIRNNLIRIRV